jgi:hypothetical protein
MNVFISWSGEKSKKIAEVLRKWFPSSLHMIKPYFSPDDIDKGTRWENEISKELDKSNFGIICLTEDNIEKPWIMFESGAIAKKLDSSRVCPILFDFERLPNTNPLNQFQAVKYNKTDFKRLFKTINSYSQEHKLEQDVLDDVFEMWYPRLEEQINKILKEEETHVEKEKTKTQKELLQELLELMHYNIDLMKKRKSSDSPQLKSYQIRKLVKELGRLNILTEELNDEGIDLQVKKLLNWVLKYTSFESELGLIKDGNEICLY